MFTTGGRLERCGASGFGAAPPQEHEEVGLLNDETAKSTKLNCRPGLRILALLPHADGSLMTTKDTVRALLDRLPDDCSLEDVQYHLYVVQAVARGRADEEAGRTIPHEQVDAELRRKWLLGRAG